MANSISTCSVENCTKKLSKRGLCSAHYQRLKRHGDPRFGRTLEGEPLRFVREVAMLYEKAECLVWPFSRGETGYAQISINGKTTLVHRFICKIAHGEPPSRTHEAAHNCGRGHDGCISPTHLSWKTPKENKADKLIHDTHSRGERSPNAKLTEAQARTILQLKGSETQVALASRYGVTPQTICRIHRRTGWAWL